MNIKAAAAWPLSLVCLPRICRKCTESDNTSFLHYEYLTHPAEFTFSVRALCHVAPDVQGCTGSRQHLVRTVHKVIV